MSVSQPASIWTAMWHRTDNWESFNYTRIQSSSEPSPSEAAVLVAKKHDLDPSVVRVDSVYERYPTLSSP